MDHENERWIKVYTRDTGGWLELSWQARGLALELSRKLDADGKLPLGRRGIQSLAGVVRGRWEDLRPFVDELLTDGRFEVLEGNVLWDPEHKTRQSAVSSPALRKKLQRYRDALSRDVTLSHAASRDVTRGHESHDQIRSEEIRSEEIPPTPRGGGLVLGLDGEGGEAWQAWKVGVGRATGKPVSDLHPRDKQDLVASSNAHAGGLRAEALMAWITATAETFAREVDGKFGGFTTKRFREWLDAGRPARAEPGGRHVQSAANRSWKMPEGMGF